MIQVKNLYHSYKKNQEYAVNDVGFNIKEGEVFGFLGPSGAGKSTTQNILTGLLPMQKGAVKVDGLDIKKPSNAYFNKIGVSFERANVYKKLTGLQNLEFHAKMYDVKTDKPKKLLEMVDLADAGNKNASDYSKGMLQRLVFARSMINYPKVWFLDEPTSGLDPATASKIKAIIKEKQKLGATIFLTTHNMFIADELCDRVAFIVDGKLSLIDSPRNLRLKYGEQFVTVEYLKDGKQCSEKLSLIEKQEKAKLNDIISRYEIQTMHTNEATLEEIFIKVTGRGLLE